MLKNDGAINIAKVPVNTTIEPDMKAKFEIVAKKNSMSYADALRVAIVEYVDKHEKNNGKLQPEKVNQRILLDESTTIRTALVWVRQLYHHHK